MADIEPQRYGAGKEGSPLYNLIAVIYVVCVMVEAMGSSVFVDKMALFTSIGGCAGGTGLAILVLVFSGRLRQLRFLWRGLCYALLTYIVLTIIVLILNVINLSQTNIITRGMGNILYQILAIFLTFSGVYLFGKRGIDFTFMGVAGAFAILIMLAVMKYGPATLISDLISLTMLGGPDTHATRSLEAHTYLAGAGYFVYYYVIQIDFRRNVFLKTKESRKNIIFSIAAIAIVMLGYKRTMLLSAGLSIAGYHVVSFVQKKSGVRTAKITLITSIAIFAAISYGYIVIIKTGLFDEFVTRMGVDTSGRARFYRLFGPYYDLSIGYIGKGYGWVNRMADSILHEGTRVETIHNQILELYIELGASGCIIFYGYFLFGNPLLFAKQYGFEVGKVFGCFIPYMLTYSFVANGIANWVISTAQWSMTFSTAAAEAEKGLMAETISSGEKKTTNEQQTG
ncbi:MAG: hypothetical protein IKP72_03300 [Clostridia bacterium]|nr:hypothetical protein [Clostridia bacterium]